MSPYMEVMLVPSNTLEKSFVCPNFISNVDCDQCIIASDIVGFLFIHYLMYLYTLFNIGMNLSSYIVAQHSTHF